MGLPLLAASAAIGAAGGLLGMSKSEKAAKEYERQVDQQKRDNQNWYNERYNRDYTQTAEALNTWRRLSEKGKEDVAAAAGTDAMMGTDSKAKVQTGYANALGELAAQQTATGEAEKRAVESEYLKRKAAIEGQQLENTQRQIAQNAQAASQGWSAMGKAFEGMSKAQMMGINPFQA